MNIGSYRKAKLNFARAFQNGILERGWYKQLVLVFLMILVVLSSPVYAKNAIAPVIVNDSTRERIDLAPYTSVLFDPVSILTVENIRQSAFTFQPVTTPYIDFGLQAGNTWLTFTVTNTATDTNSWRLDLGRQRLRNIDVYAVREAKPVAQQAELLLSNSYHHRFADRPIANRFLAVDIPIARGESVAIYIRYTSHETTWLPMQLSRLAAYSEAHTLEDRINWSFNGALFAMMVIALVVAPLVGWHTSLTLCAYIFTGGLFIFHAGGYTFQVLWPDAQGTLNEPLGLTTMLAMALSAPLFARALFNTRETLPRIDRWLKVQLWIIAGFILVSIPLHQYVWFRVIAYPLVVIVAIVQLYTGVLAKRAQLVGAIPFLIGATFVSFTLLFALAAHLFSGHISLEHTLDFGQLALIVESTVFAIAVVLRSLEFRQQRDDAMQAELLAAQEKIQLTQALLATQKAYDHAKRLAQQRREQLSSLGHDIRQPLTALRLAVTNVTAADDPAFLQLQSAFDYFEKLARSHSAATHHPSDSAKSTLTETFDLSAVLDNVYEMFREEAQAKGLEFRYRRRDFPLHTNPIALMRMVNNLVSNAIKYTDNGGILLTARQRHTDIRIEVWDTGIGMDAETLTAVMQARVKGRQSDGDGLGLPIVANMAEELGLAFDIVSRANCGTYAAIRLPLAIT